MIRTCFIAAACLTLLPVAPGQNLGVINDLDGYTNVRAGQDGKSAVVAKVQAGDVFEFESNPDSEWWKVTLASGKPGWMHRSRIRMHFTIDDIEEKDEEGSEVGAYAKERGFDYCSTARAAAMGRPQALERYFGITDTDGGAAESHAAYFCTVIHLLGDAKLAAFLEDQPLPYRIGVRNQMFNELVFYPFEDVGYSERNFPRTTRALCRKEIVDWTSPDGSHAIKKLFSEAQVTPESRVVKAELIEKRSGKVIADLSADDIGTGLNREGRVLWSADSRRFALMSGALGAGGAAQTVVYERSDGRVERVRLPRVDLPGRAEDSELEGAERLWTFVEPRRWEGPQVLVLVHHEYFEKLRADRSIQSMGRTYELTWDLTTGNVSAREQRERE